jgi:hypothetical protein
MTNAVTIPKNAMGIKTTYANTSIGIPNKKNTRLFFEKVKEKANVRIPIAISRWPTSILLNDPGFPTSRFPFGMYIYSRGERS